MNKLADGTEFDAIILAAAGLKRLGFQIRPDGTLTGPDSPNELKAAFIELDQMLPCVGQAAIGIEIRENDEQLEKICASLNHHETWHCVTAERAFLRALGGGCQSAVAAFGEMSGEELSFRAISFLNKQVQQSEARSHFSNAVEMGEKLAREFLAGK